MTPVMGALATYTRGLLRTAGLVLIVIGAAGLTVGYLGWKDQSARMLLVQATPPADPAKPANLQPPAARHRTSRGAGRASAVPRKASPGRTAKLPPRQQPVVTQDAGATGTAAAWKYSMKVSGGALLAGVLLVLLSLHERPPKLPRSAADEMLNDPVPF
jgi:hypothetical protein